MKISYVASQQNGIQFLSLEVEGEEAQEVYDLLRDKLAEAISLTPEQRLDRKLRAACAKHYIPGREDLNNFIAAIKEVRGITGWGLKETKDWVEANIK